MTAKVGRKNKKPSAASANSARLNKPTKLLEDGRNGKHFHRNNSGSSAKTLSRGSDLTTSDASWAQIERLYFELLESFYERELLNESKPLAKKLNLQLKTTDPKEESIFGSECRALVAEVDGDFAEAIRHRCDEIEKIQRLWRSASDPKQLSFFRDLYRPADLSDRYDLLAILYYDAGKLKKAIRTLWKSRELCEEHGVKFDGGDLLRDYLKELRAAAKKQS